MEKLKAGQSVMSTRFLEELLHLPEGNHIIAISIMDSDTIKLIIKGPDMPDAELGSTLPYVQILHQRIETSFHVIAREKS